ncbi:MAG: hypothetical protein H7A23_08880 [Leptospiraceae bacterium]|nr:hypothetical protein [Leptospiraceae bacterium]MCP5494656.1 hypothetical protein [Leptospiraceae bacterium]
MVSRKALIFLVIVAVFSCRSKNTNQEDGELLVYLLNTQTSNPVQKSCNEFASLEKNCVKEPDSITLTCSNEEIERIRHGIEPSDKRTDDVLSGFYDCWSKCNIVYNNQETICSNQKFQTSKYYRESQKSGESQASISWGVCIEKCNQGESQEPSLKDANVTYTTQVYKNL